MSQPVNVYVVSIKGVKTIQLVYLNDYQPDYSEIPELKDCLLLEKIIADYETKEIWIYQPYVGNFELEYADHEYFDILEDSLNRERQNYDYKGMATASLFANNKQIITYNTQDLSKHVLTAPRDETWWQKVQQDFNISDELLTKIRLEIPEVLRTSGLDIRDALKHFIPIPSGVGYDLNPGNHQFNHSEARTFFDYLGVKTEAEFDAVLLDPAHQEKVELLKGSACYLYGHWWSCTDCSRKMEKAGVAKVVISKKWVKEYTGL